MNGLVEVACPLLHSHNRQFDNIVKKIDKNKSGKIDFSEFETAMIDRKKLFV